MHRISNYCVCNRRLTQPPPLRFSSIAPPSYRPRAPLYFPLLRYPSSLPRHQRFSSQSIQPLSSYESAFPYYATLPPRNSHEPSPSMDSRPNRQMPWPWILHPHPMRPFLPTPLQPQSARGPLLHFLTTRLDSALFQLSHHFCSIPAPAVGHSLRYGVLLTRT